MTLLNIDESKRFKKGAFRFWGCLPVYQAEAATNAGATIDQVRKRIAEVHQAGLHVVLEAIKEIGSPAPYRFANGEVHVGEGRLAFFMGDQPAHDKHAAKKSKSCRMCGAPHDKLADTDEVWPLIDWRACKLSMLRTAATCLDDDGKVIYGKMKVITAWEKKYGMHFMHNSVFEFADEIGLDPVLGLPRDFLHWIILGLFGYHIVKAIIYLISKIILADAYLTAHVNRPAPVNQTTMHHVLQRLARRLASITADESCLTISQEFAQHFLKVYENGKSSFTGPRMTYLILVLPYVMVDLVGIERRNINDAIDRAVVGDPLHGLPHVEDPCEQINDALLVFLKWFLLVRRRELPTSEICSLTERGIELMEKLKEVFPEKSGEEQAWNFRKFHDILHTSVIIMFFGWLENTSCQSGELAHKILLKALAGNLNNYNVFIQFLRYWERYEQLSRAGREAADAGEADGSDSDDDKVRKEDRAREEAMHACELGTRCPLFFMALHRTRLHHTPASTGGSWPSGAIKGRVAFNVWNLPAVSVQELPSLQSLPLELSKFAYDYLSKSLGLPKPADPHGRPSIAELNGVLLKNLVVDKGGSHVRTWGTLELESDLCLGVQRVRCFPFSSDKAWRCNPMQYVVVIPPKKYTDIPFARFDMADEAHRRQLWFGRAELFFRCAFQDSNKSKKFEVDLVLVSCLYDFKCPEAQTILQTEGGARMFYKPDKEWLIVLPINHILGRVPLMKAYLRGSRSPTIPASFAPHKHSYFRHGHSDRNGAEGGGSQLFMLNVHMWQFGRPQPRTISVQQRRANLEKAQKACNNKRKQRLPYTQERAARRRAMQAAQPAP